MARKATVDVNKVMQMLLEGQSTQSVAEYFGVSRQAIDLHRRKFIQSGQLMDKRAPRVSTASTGYNAEVVKKMPETVEKSKNNEAVSLDRLIELVIEAFNSLKKLPILEAELEKYRQDYQKAAERIEQLEKEVSKREAQEARWKLAMTTESDKSNS